MKKYILLILTILFFSISVKANATSYYYEWENTIVYIPVGESINKYKNEPVAYLYVDRVRVSDASITYLIDGDWLCYLADVDTSVVGEYEVWYKAYENGKYKPGTCPGYKCKVKFVVEDKSPPSIKIIKDNVRVRRNSKYDVTSNVIAKDNYSKELTFIDNSNINYSKLGDYEVDLVVIDEYNNESYAKYTLTIYEDSYPTIINKSEGQPINIEIDSVANLSSYFTASDEIDGDLSDSIKFPYIDTSKVGVYTYQAEVENKVGMKSSIDFLVKINDDKKPEITLTKDAVSLDYKLDFQSYDFKKYIAKIDDNLPIDYTNLTIKNNIENKVGSYNVWYEYNDGTYVASSVLSVKLRSYEKPSIVVDDISITASESFNILDYITINDASDANVIESLEVFDDDVDYDTPGEYYLEVYVINSSGLSETKRVKISVNADEVEDTTEQTSTNKDIINSFTNDNNKYFMIIIIILVIIIVFLLFNKIKAFKKKP